nr:muscle M-line assembly protein unc-89-like [Coffea arabica]
MESHENIDKMYYIFNDLIKDLEVLEKNYSLGEKNRKILNALSKDWENKVTAIEEAKDLNILPIESLINSLTTYELKLKSKVQEEEDTKIRRSIALKVSQDENDTAFLDREDMEEEKVEEEEESAQVAFMAIGDEEVNLINIVKKSKWFIDSGCSKHMTSDASQFIKLKPKTSGKVTFGDDNKAKTVGIGDIGVQKELKKLTICNQGTVSSENVSKEGENQDSPAREDNDRDTTIPNDLSRVWKFVQNHPKELIIGDPSEKMGEHHSEENPVSRNAVEMEKPTYAEVAVAITKSPGRRKRSAQKRRTAQSNVEKNAEDQHTPEPSTRKSPRTRSEVQNTESSAKQTAKRKRSVKEPETQPTKEPTPLPKFIDDEARDRFEWSHDDHVPCPTVYFIKKRNLLVPPIPEFNENAHQKEPTPQPTEHTPGIEATPEAHASSSQPKDKGKAPITEEATEEDHEETEEEDQVDPEQFRLTRRKSGSSKITI